jgi:hypothetical protein
LCQRGYLFDFLRKREGFAQCGPALCCGVMLHFAAE